MKKIIIVFLALIVLNFLNIQTVSGNSSYEKERKQSELLNEYSKFIKKSKNYTNFNEEYAGAYFDEDGNLVLNVVKNMKEKFMNGNTINEDFEVKEVKYSLKEINKSLKEVEKLVEIGVIESVGRSEMDNTLIVTVGANSIEIQKVVMSTSKLDNIIFQESVIGFESKFTVNYVVNGTKARIQLSYPSNSDYEVTVGFAARNSDGDPGFVTTGHGGLHNGNNVYCDVGFFPCGDVKQISFGNYSYTDAAFVELRDPWFSEKFLPTKEFMNGDYYIGVHIDTDDLNDLYVQNATIYAYGDVSGKQSGKILQTYFSSTVEGFYLMGFVKSDYMAVDGDSGAAVTYWMYAGSATSYRMVMGIQSYSYIISGDWVPGVSYSCFSRVDKIIDDLDLTVY